MRFLTRTQIGTRLTAGFAILLLLLIGLTAIGVVEVNKINGSLSAINDLNSVKQRYAINFRGSVHDRAISLRDVTLVDDDASRTTVLAGIDKLAADYARSAERMDKLFAERSDISPEEVRILASIKETEARTLPLMKKVIASQQAGDAAGAKEVLMRDARPAFVEWLGRINQFIDLQESLNQKESALARQTAQRFQTLMILLSLGATVVGAVGAWLITRSLTGPVGEAIMASELIATGDLRYVTAETGGHETARLLQSLGRMSSNLDQIVAQVREASDSVATGSEQIATGNADLSLRTERQAGSLQETASSLRQLTTTVKNNEDTAREANLLAASASETAAEGGKSMTKVVATMEGISAASRKIADIISVIDGIAFQTNILALNAAVEAARAGEQGRGFAVVASEVRSLARRSADAAKDIKTLITDNVERVQAGSQEVGLARENMNDIVAQVGKVCGLIGEISSATGAQSRGIGQVGVAIDSLDQVTQQNAALVEESAAAAENLKVQASRLLDAVSVFKLTRDRVAA